MVSAERLNRRCAMLCLVLALSIANTAHTQLCPSPSPNTQTYPFPLNTSSMCNWLGLSTPGNVLACSLFDLLVSLLTSVTPELHCGLGGLFVLQPKSVDKQGKALPQLLPDLRKDGKLPANLPASILSTEGATYNFYYRAVYTFYSWAPCATLHVPTAYPFPEGFELVKVIPLTEDLTPHNLSQAASIPMAAVLKQPNACGAGCDHLVVLIRGTRTKPEQVIDFQYSMVPATGFVPANTTGALLHKAFKKTALQIWKQGLQQVLDDQVLAANGGSSGSIKLITVAGQSLGAAMATLLSVKIKLYISSASTAAVTAVLFAAPNVGNGPWARVFNSLVNARNVRFEYDLVAQVPCSPRVVACSNVAIPTNRSADQPQAWPYARVGGTVRLLARNMPYQAPVWQRLASYTQQEFCSNPLTVQYLQAATHACAYVCSTARYVNGSDNWCLLWPANGTEASQASYCYADFFPAEPLFPSA